jgi:hypothetical protein
VCNQLKQVTKFSNALPSFGNSIFSRAFLVKHSKSWQAHLENIGDYLLHGEGIWWGKTENESIEFFYAVENPDYQPEGPVLHHFRSTTFEGEQKYLAASWIKKSSG